MELRLMIKIYNEFESYLIILKSIRIDYESTFFVLCKLF